MKWKEGKIDGVELRSANKHADNRGWLAEIFRADEIKPDVLPVMGYISVTRAGVTRGPHEHREQTDMFGFLGPGNFRVKMWDNRKNSPTYGNIMTIEAGESNPVILTVPPGVVHGYMNISKIDGWAVNLPNRLFRGKERKKEVDEIRYEDSKNSPFLM